MPKQKILKCGDCLVFKTPKCSLVNINDIKHGYDLYRPTDHACGDFYPLVDRLKLKKRYTRMVNRKVEDYVISGVEV